MSQRSEKYAHNVRQAVDKQQARIRNVEMRVDNVERVNAILSEQYFKGVGSIRPLAQRVAALEREQRRRQVSRGRIALLSSTAAVCTALIWVSLMIFRLV